MTTYLVSGLGVSFICSSQEAVAFWTNEILDKGGIPSVRIMAAPLKEAA